jgi:hypothetical protein
MACWSLSAGGDAIELMSNESFSLLAIAIIIIIVVVVVISCHRFSFFPGTSALEPVVNPSTQASSLSL